MTRPPEPIVSPPDVQEMERRIAGVRDRMAAEGLPEMLTVDEVARLNGVHRSTVWAWIADGLPRVRVGRVTRIPASELIAWVRERVVVG